MLYRDIRNKNFLNFIQNLIDKSKNAVELTKIILKTKNYDENKIVFYKQSPIDF